MITYVETNFVLELAFLQKEHDCCAQLLNLAEKKQIELLVPAYSLGEAYEKLIRRRNERAELLRRLGKELSELGRTIPYADAVTRFSELTNFLSDSNEHEYQRLVEIHRRILDVATIIPTELQALQLSLSAQKSLGLSPQDSIVYASVQHHLATHKEASCFLNKNTRDFSNPKIRNEFTAHGCQVIATFTDGLSYISNQLQQQTTPPSSPN